MYFGKLYEKTKPIKEILGSHCVYKNLCECGRDYIDQTAHLMGVRLMEHKFNQKERHLRKSKLALYVFAERH